MAAFRSRFGPDRLRTREPDGSGESEPQPRLVDLLAEAVQSRLGVLLLAVDGRAEPGGGSAEEVQRVLAAAPAAETIKFGCESRDIEPVGITQRHRKAQHCQLPGAEQPVMVFD